MTKQITIPMMETDAVDSFTVSEQYVDKWNYNTKNYQTYEVSEQDVADFDALVDSVYATLTHKQKKQLLDEALETFNNTYDFLTTLDTNQDFYNVSARQCLTMCISCSLGDYCETMPA